MLFEIGVALGITIGVMIVVGTIIHGMLNLRSAITWLMQTAALFTIVSVFSFTSLQTIILLSLPAVLHILLYLSKKRLLSKTANGDYGEEAKWAYELFQEEDDQFIRANAVLPESEITEVTIIADSKQELRNLMVERLNEHQNN